jgi:hypothetical protein
MTVHKAYLEIRPIGPNRTHFKLIVNNDPKFDLIPQSLLNWGMKHVTYKIMELI